MSFNENHLYAIRVIDEEIVHIDDVPNGKNCGCICSKCKESLIAKNGGTKYRPHFAHRNSSNCAGETLAHLKAKEIIKQNKYLWLPTVNSKIKVQFDHVEDEKEISESNYIADLICQYSN